MGFTYGGYTNLEVSVMLTEVLALYDKQERSAYQEGESLTEAEQDRMQELENKLDDAGVHP